MVLSHCYCTSKSQVFNEESQNLIKMMKLRYDNKEIKEILMKEYNKLLFVQNPLIPTASKEDTKVIFCAPDDEGQ